MRPTLLIRPRMRAATAPQGAASSLLRLSAAAARLPSVAALGQWARRAARPLDDHAAATPAAA